MSAADGASNQLTTSADQCELTGSRIRWIGWPTGVCWSSKPSSSQNSRERCLRRTMPHSWPSLTLKPANRSVGLSRDSSSFSSDAPTLASTAASPRDPHVTGGVLERINIFMYQQWIAVLAFMLMRQHKVKSQPATPYKDVSIRQVAQL
jgi:hypothetical protein